MLQKDVFNFKDIPVNKPSFHVSKIKNESFHLETRGPLPLFASYSLKFINHNLLVAGRILQQGGFSVNNLKMVKAVIMRFCRDQKYYIRNMFAKFAIPSSS